MNTTAILWIPGAGTCSGFAKHAVWERMEAVRENRGHSRGVTCFVYWMPSVQAPQRPGRILAKPALEKIGQFSSLNSRSLGQARQ